MVLAFDLVGWGTLTLAGVAALMVLATFMVASRTYAGTTAREVFVTHGPSGVYQGADNDGMGSSVTREESRSRDGAIPNRPSAHLGDADPVAERELIEAAVPEGGRVQGRIGGRHHWGVGRTDRGGCSTATRVRARPQANGHSKQALSLRTEVGGISQPFFSVISHNPETLPRARTVRALREEARSTV
jgi:hypothetical protein